MTHLDLSAGGALGLLLRAFRVFPGFLDEGERLVHDRRVVHMGGRRAGGAGRRAPDPGG